MSSVAVPVSPSLPRPSAAELRRLVEAELSDRIPGALSPHERVAPEMASSGIAALDELAGGWPRGTLSELFGPASSGRTSVLVAALAAATARSEACALVDAGDSFDPESAAAAGVDLKQLLWVRCGKNSPQRRGGAEKNDGKWQMANGKKLLTSRSFVSSCLRGESIPTPQPRDIGIWGYGDTETMERINPALARKNPPQKHRVKAQQPNCRTAELPNSSDSLSEGHDFSRAEKSNLRICHSEAKRSAAEESAFAFYPSASPRLRGEGLPQRGKYRTAYARIEQALKAADLLLGAGGFGLVIVDLAGLPPEAARRVPLTTWFRFRRAVEATGTVLLVVSPQAITQSCAALALRLQATGRQQLRLPDYPIPRFPDQPCGSPSHTELLTGFRLRAEVVRSLLPGRKRPHSSHAEIVTEAQWA